MVRVLNDFMHRTVEVFVSTADDLDSVERNEIQGLRFRNDWTLPTDRVVARTVGGGVRRLVLLACGIFTASCGAALEIVLMALLPQLLVRP